ncbi:hypothetical protein NSK_006776 [Nannochloropsis salina CCMP1776]|uniref:Uncharacterized protein n=1 Tax=Nannochloropsis salina CCMP1776 TaxID=1027361 RepID=A0A4D9CS75_9STRA|nr:hypothetical protein NSK_006776 [Nannochloropsis salina CCMP1776]|eukprot:TFJ82111.1 hypothetical protein NSK_006776 [Nannochloropsis salina CCMP1776]
MSLGFLTESALLPSKAKPIDVDGRSQISLKAVVAEGLSQRRTTDEKETTRRRRGRRHRALEEAKGRKDVYRGENRGVEARRRRDEEGKEEAKEEGREDAAERMLGRKEQEYARLVEEGKEGGEEEAVVDFARKKREREGEGEGGREGGRYVVGGDG